MKKAIVLIIALVLLPLNFAFAAPAGQADLRTQLEQARAQKAEQMTVILQEAELMKDVLNHSNHAPLPVVSLDAKPNSGDPA